MKSLLLRALACLGIAVVLANVAFAEGNETLGTPSISLASGTGYVGKGIGLTMSQPGIINLNVPPGVTIQQVLLYWEGQHSTPAGDDQITIAGNSVTGTLIGGPNYFFTNNFTVPQDVYSSTYRADITSLALVVDGANAIAVQDMDFDVANNGAGLLVIYDDGTTTTNLQLVDGNDLAYKFFAAPRDAMVAQTFTFVPATINRTADLTFFFSSVQGTVSTGGPQRPNRVSVTVGATTTDYDDVLNSSDGEEWDTYELTVNIPAGETSVTVQPASGPGGDDNENTPDPKPASFAWIAAALSVPPEPPQCTGTIGDFVWKDTDCDGTQELGEPGIPGVTVKLYDGSNTLLQTTTTNGSGFYLFDSLCEGTYVVEIDGTTLPAGYTATTCSNVADDGTNSNCSPATTVLVGEADNDLTIDFGYCAPPPPCLGNIGDFVWKDLDCDGNQETGELGIPGVTVKLYDGSDVLLQTTVTNATGYYIFDSLCAGVYKVIVDGTTLPAGYTPTTCSNVAGNGTNSNCSPATVVLATENTVDLTIDFGYCVPPPCLGKIGDFVWKDLDCDGNQEGGETGIAGVTVKLYDGSDVLLKTTVTNASGYYFFDSLCAGTYKVKVEGSTVPAGYTPTTCSNVTGNGTNSNCSPATVVLATANTVDLTIDFGYCVPPPPCVPKEFIFCGNNSTCGTYGNIRNFTVNGTSVNVSAFSRFKNAATWQTAYLGLYDLGLGVTDRYESGNNGTHRVDNVDKNNYVLFEFSQPVVVDKAFLDAISYDSDISVWYGTFTNPYTSHITLSDAVLGGMATEQNAGATTARWADFNGGQVLANVLVIAADVQDTSPEDWFKIRKLDICAPPPPPPPCVPKVIEMTGNTSVCGSPGNIRTFTSNGVSVKASAWSRPKTVATWQTAYLGAYSGGLGVTDRYESGNNNTHRVDNIDKNNYVLFEFSQPVVLSRAYLDMVLYDSDISLWIGTFANPYNNHLALSDAMLAGMLTEQNLTSSSGSRWASFNAGQVTANVLVIAADVQDTNPEDWFKIRKLEIACPTGGQGMANSNGAEEEVVDAAELPTETKLLQNYPNPFNPSTAVSFELKDAATTTLKIYNTLGQEIKTLVSEDLNAGVYTFTWDATDNTGSRVASGVYFYHLRAGEFSSIKKMSLVK